MKRLAARRVPVTERVAAATRYDYADAFELSVPGSDPLEPREWLSRGLDDSPAIIEFLTSALLGIRDKPTARPEDLADWIVVESTPELIHVERSLPLMRVTIVARRLAAGRRLTSVLAFNRPAIARPLWAVLGIGHRFGAKRLLSYGLPAATTVAQSGER